MGVANRETHRALVSRRLNSLRRLLPGMRSYLRISPWLTVVCCFLMAGAGTVARAQEPRPKQIEILFATDRAAPVAGAKIAFGHAAGETITFGKAVVVQKAGAQPIPLDRFALRLLPLYRREVVGALRELAREERPQGHLAGGNESHHGSHGNTGVPWRPRTTSWYS